MFADKQERYNLAVEKISLIINSAGDTTAVTSDSQFGEFSVDVKDFVSVTDWRLKPEGLCKGSICIPVRRLEDLTDGLNIDLVEFARLTNRNLVIDKDQRVAALGEHADTRSELMTSLDAPDFTLPDIHGKRVSFSDFNRRKRLLLAWSSW